MKTKIIPFDLETAKKIQDGEIEGKIKTEGGKNARIICWDKKNEHHFPIVALIDNIQREELYLYSEAGEYGFGSSTMLNLVLEVQKESSPQKIGDMVAEAYAKLGEVAQEIADLYKEVPYNEPKFKPFDKVLVRDRDYEEWRISLYESCGNNGFYVLHGLYYSQCIPYAGNENLVGTTGKPKEE